MGEGQPLRVVLDTASAFWASLLPYLSKLIVALIILVVGIIIAKILEKLIVQVLKVARFDVLSEKSGIASILAKGEIKHSLSELLGIMIYWLLILVVAIITLTIGGLPPTGLLENAVIYAGNVVLSIFILILGLFLAAFVGSIVRTTASNAGMGTAKNLGSIAQIVIIVITVLTILPKLGVRTFILDTVVVVALAATGLALGLAFGLGSKDIAGKIMSELVDKWKKR